MNSGKHPHKASGLMKKSLVLAVAVLLLVSATIAGALAFLTDSTTGLKNIFTPSQVKTQVEETFQNGVKTNVTVKNTGDTSGWIRAAVVITWQDAQGNVYSQTPVKDTDYTITYTKNWLTGKDGFYYYPSPVDAGDSTGVLISQCKLMEKANVPQGYSLCVEIICSGLQSKPASVFNTNWASSGLKVNEQGTALEKSK